MKVAKKRIRSVTTNFPFLQPNTTIVVGLRDLTDKSAQLVAAGFDPSLAPGESILPAGRGAVSRFNAEGKYVRQQPPEQETAYRMIEWTWTERHGDQEVERSDFRYVPYKRYKRDFVTPPAVEMLLTLTTTGEKVLVTDALTYTGPETDTVLLHRVNLLLDSFGECEILTEDFDQIIRAEVRRLNWQVLPQGQRSWATLRDELEPLVERQKPGNQGVIRRRFAFLNSYEPDFVAVGRAGFSGYVVFGFSSKNLFVLESVLTNNATYVFGQDWETLSQMTKTDILDQGLQQARVFHTNGWTEQIDGILA